MADISNDNILTSIKKLLNISVSDESFDTDIIIHINSAFMILNQLGVGPDEPYRISDSTPTWSDYDSNIKNQESVKTFIYMKTRLAFDPPTTSFALESFSKQADELAWRLMTKAEEDKT